MVVHVCVSPTIDWDLSRESDEISSVLYVMDEEDGLCLNSLCSFFFSL